MRQWLKFLAGRIDERSIRERALLTLALLAMIAGLWEVFFLGPLQQQRDTLQQQAATLRQSVDSLNSAITIAAHKMAEDPNEVTRERLARARAQTRHVDDQLKAITAGLTEPRKMASMLEKILKAQHGLRLLSMTNQAAQPVNLGQGGNGDTAAVFRHGLTIKFKGSFLDTLTYIKALDALPGQFYWDGLHLKMQHYPTNEVTLTVHTINFSEGWLGV